MKSTMNKKHTAILDDYKYYLDKTIHSQKNQFYNTAQKFLTNHSGIIRIENLTKEYITSMENINTWKKKKLLKFYSFLTLRGIVCEGEGAKLNKESSLSVEDGFEDFILHEKASGKSRSTIDNYYLRYERFRAFLNLRALTTVKEINTRVIENYKEYLYTSTWGKESKSYSNRMQIFFLQFVKKLFSHLYRREFILYNPAKKVKTQRSPKELCSNFLPHSALKGLFIRWDPVSGYDKRDYLILFLAYFYGLRVSEIASFALKDIDFRAKYLYIRQSKGAKDRVLPLLKPVGEMLRIYIQNVRPSLYADNYARKKFAAQRDETILFPGRYNKGRMFKTTLNHLFKSVLEKAGIAKKVSFHCLRYSCTGSLLKSGLGVRYVQKLLGHSKLDTTGMYARLDVTELKKVLADFHPRERSKAAIRKVAEQKVF